MDEAKYGIAEFSRSARKLLNTTPEVVTVALREAGLKEATRKEAEETIKAFLAKEVK